MSEIPEFWGEMERRGADYAVVDGVEIRKGSRVVLRPRQGGDVFDIALANNVAIVEAVEEDAEGDVHVVVTLESDPGRDLGEGRFPAHRFFFTLEEVEPFSGPSEETGSTVRILVAGIGNVFLGDDGFGVEVVRALTERALPEGVDVVDFGIRGMDLAYALQRGYDAVIFVDAAPLGEPPGSLAVIEPDLELDGTMVDAHGMDPVKVLALARQLGGIPERTLVVACQPELIVDGAPEDELVGELSDPVRHAVGEAATLVETLVADLIGGQRENALRQKGGI